MTIKNIEWALTGDDKGFKLASKELFYMFIPGEWRPDKFNEMYKADDIFENQCILLEKNGILKPDDLNLFQFYKRLDYLKKSKTKK